MAKDKNKKDHDDVSSLTTGKADYPFEIHMLNTQGIATPLLNTIDGINSIKSSILSVNELSAGLSVAMPETGILNLYDSALTSQIEALASIPAITVIEKSYLQAQNTLIGNYAPLSSALAGIGLANANAIKLFESGTIAESLMKTTQKISDLCLSSIEGQQSIFSNSLKFSPKSGMLSALNKATLASTEMINNGLNAMVTSLPTYPELNLYNLRVVQDIGEVKEEKISEHQKDLDKMLEKIDPELVSYRKGCWNTFHRKEEDYVGQCASSMRRLVDSIFRILAPIEKVEETNFFKTSPKGKDKNGRPTRQARVCYMVDYDKKKSEHIERLIKGFLESWDNLSAWDHKPLDKDTFVHGAFITIEGYLMSLLSESEFLIS